MREFYNDFGFMIGFLVMVLLWNLAFDSKGTFYFLVLVLLGMVVLNSGSVTAWVENTFNK